ncbi:hypothetical protein [Enterocloster citroniae]|uniref:hypothetical protein n=1 Tax=Enterocloster citroniae TaxID=358743 RepID=UPI000E3F45E0|nr:hypothetical protein [Enterocloster citroniae]RGC10059.1 hypothetical protein DWZ14_15455 [Enterocloster citroniae]
MVSEKRVRETIKQSVERYLLDDDFDSILFDYAWICAQLSFAYDIHAIAFEEYGALRNIVTYAYQNNGTVPECVDFLSNF